MRSNFAERRAARAERYAELAEKNRVASTLRYEQARQIGDAIPFGQPILVGHHSEKRHRRDLERIDTNMRKSIEHDRKADYYERRAASAESNRAIFSDDPEAVRLLREKIAMAERNQEYMKAVNKHVRRMKDNPEACIITLQAEGLTEAQARAAIEPDPMGRSGFPSYALKNNSANIRRMKQRLADLERLGTAESTEETIGDVRIVQNVEDNRTQLFFPGRPSDEIRASLKGAGFRWYRTGGCWQRHLSRQALWVAQAIAKASNEE